jgi:hypothetical protein
MAKIKGWVVMDKDEQWGHLATRNIIRIGQMQMLGKFIGQIKNKEMYAYEKKTYGYKVVYEGKKIKILGKTKTKKEAIDIAQKYMRSHPNG